MARRRNSGNFQPVRTPGYQTHKMPRMELLQLILRCWAPMLWAELTAAYLRLLLGVIANECFFLHKKEYRKKIQGSPTRAPSDIILQLFLYACLNAHL